jgi:anti-anti-sigma regulatory factor/PAS domain-containing protein
MQEADTHTRSPASSLAAVLAEVHVGIAHATAPGELLAALVPAFAPYGPARCELHLLHGEHGGMRELELAASWTADGISPPTGARTPLAADPLAPRWLAAPDDVLQLTDLADEPRLRAALAPHRAITVLPLYSRSHDAVQGCVRLLWLTPHTSSPTELFVARLLMQTVAAALASRRTVQAHAEALAETQALHAAQARLHAAGSHTELLAVVAELARTHAADSASIGRVDPDADGQPAFLEILAVWGTTAVVPGARFHVPALARPPQGGDPTQFIADVATDPVIDHGVRELATRFELRAAVSLPLYWRGRWTGMIILGWSAPHEFTARERRLYPAIARQAAVVFDSRLLLARTRAALDDHQRQRATLTALLDNLPVGVVVHATDRDEPVLHNRTAVALARDVAAAGLLVPGTDAVMPPSQWPLARARASGHVAVGEAELREADGERRTLESVAAPVHDEHGALSHVIVVTAEVTERRRAEAERLQMQAALIDAQAAALAERSTPLLPISDEILVMPIVGGVDDERGRQITETLVELGGQRRVRVAIIDLTGASELDDRSAAALVGAARAVRLRGAVPMLTGLRPEAAAALTDLGVDLEGVLVRGTLQSGIAHAQALVARRSVPRDTSQ